MAEFDFEGAAELRGKVVAEYETAKERITADTLLSPEGRVDALGKADAHYRAQLGALLDAGQMAIGQRRAAVQRDFDAQRAATAAMQVTALGPQLMAELHARDLRGMTPEGILAAVRDAPAHPWTQQTMHALALAELRERARAGAVDADIPLRELERLAEPPSTAAARRELAQLEAQARELESWGPDYAARIAARYNVK